MIHIAVVQVLSLFESSCIPSAVVTLGLKYKDKDGPRDFPLGADTLKYLFSAVWVLYGSYYLERIVSA